MKRLLMSVVILLGLVGCGPGQFTVKQSDDRFTENKNPLLISENNRISSKSAQGGVYVNDKGIYLNPFVEKSKTTNQVIALGFNVINKTDYNTMTGDIDQLGLLNEVVFRINDGQLITLRVAAAENTTPGTVSFNTVARYASSDKSETGIVSISRSDYEKLIGATAISFKIAGTKRSRVYEEKDISSSFLPNLRQFYQTYVK